MQKPRGVDEASDLLPPAVPSTSTSTSLQYGSDRFTGRMSASGADRETDPAATFPPPLSQHLDQQSTTRQPPAQTTTSLAARLKSNSGKKSDKQQEMRSDTAGRRFGGRVPQIAFELENKGSVARDHLAGERTFLAWLRTSLALASIGIAITQLFRLPASTTGTPTTQPSSSDQIAQINSAFEPILSEYPQLAALRSLLEAQQLEIAQSVAKIENATRYRHLGKPIGGTLIALALVFLFIGTHRYFSVQKALMENPSMFPPSRRSVAFSGFCVGALVLAAFAAVLATR